MIIIDDVAMDSNRIESVKEVVTRYGEPKTVVTMHSGEQIWLRGHRLGEILSTCRKEEN